jgi:NitT/TauT family transport system substrate-binding protein
MVADPGATRGRAIAQASADRTDYSFPLAIYDAVSAKDGEITLRFKPLSGKVDQAGGIAIRLADPDNYYVLCANAVEDNVNFYRVIKGRRQQITGANTKVASNAWHQLGPKAEGARFTVSFDGKKLFTATDKNLTEAGKIALWTKAGSVTLFDRSPSGRCHHGSRIAMTYAMKPLACHFEDLRRSRIPWLSVVIFALARHGRSAVPSSPLDDRRIARFSLMRVVLAALIGLVASTAGRAEPVTIRVGHFPNVTHVQGLVAHGLSRQGKGWFEARLGPDVKIEWFVYNAGPSAIEAIFANSVDLVYVGPSPAINGYAKARGEDIRIIAGAVEGGAALVVQPDAQLAGAADFRGKRIATPQLGNTQDVAARAWLTTGGLRITLTGGDAQVIPTANPDQLSLFQSRQIDAVWTVEPWVSRLEKEAGGKVLVEETDAVTTVLATGAKFIAQQRDLARRCVAAHQELTSWVRSHPDEAQAMVRSELTAETRAEMTPDLVAHAWGRIVLTPQVSREALERFVGKAQQAGFLRAAPDLARLIEKF